MDGDVACAVADVVALEGWLRSGSLERSDSGGQRAQLHAEPHTSGCGHDGKGHPMQRAWWWRCKWCCGLCLVSGVLAGTRAFYGCTSLATFSGPLVTSIGPCELPALRPRNTVAVLEGATLHEWRRGVCCG